MLTAIRASDRQKVIGAVIPKDPLEKYTCPNPKCGKDVNHHRSKAGLVIGHFKHKAGFSTCPLRGEKLVHVRAKFDIYQYVQQRWEKNLKAIEVEHYVADNKLRPDVYMETKSGTRIGIEVQASELTVDEIRRRTALYHREGIFVLWVLLFEFRRFYEKLSAQWEDHVTTFSSSGYDDRWVHHRKVRLHAYEQFIYWSYLKSLTLWDLDHEYSDGFIVVELSQHVADDSYFYNDRGEEQIFAGRRSKTMKVVGKVHGNVKLSDMSKGIFPTPFEMRSLPYSIPPRKVLLFKAPEGQPTNRIRVPKIARR